MPLVRRACNVNISGAITWQDDGPGSFSSRRDATGRYRVTLPQPCVNTVNYACLITPRSITDDAYATYAYITSFDGSMVSITTNYFSTNDWSQGFSFEIFYETA